MTEEEQPTIKRRGSIVRSFGRTLSSIGSKSLRKHPDGMKKHDWADTTNLLREMTIPYWLIDPRSLMMRRWDMFIFVALIWTATVTPVEVAFSKVSIESTSAIFMLVLNRFVDAVFIIDIVINFFLMVEIPHPVYGQRLLKSHSAICRRYLTGWFIIDLVTVIPFDVIAFFSNDDFLEKLKSIRVIRLLRLLKLVRIIRSSRIIQRWQSDITLPFAYVSIIRFAILLVIGMHWAGCIWGLTGIMQLEELQNNIENMTDIRSSSWIFENAQATSLEPLTPLSDEVFALKSDVWKLYLICLYWSIATITSIGYGDIVPCGTGEYIVCIILMWIVGVLWAYCIGSFCGIIATLDPEGMSFTSNLLQKIRLMMLIG